MAPATLTPPRERVRRGTGSGTGKPWRVIVLNDDHNTFLGVAYAISNVLPGVSYEDGMKETAELYWTQLNDFGLTMAPLEQ